MNKPVKPVVINDLLLRLGSAATGDEYQRAISSAILTPASGVVNFQGGEPDASFTFPGATTWTLELVYAQDVETPGSLTQYLWDHRGEEVDFALEPKKGGASWTGKTILAPGAIGGAVAAVATATVSLGVQGEPEPTFPTTSPDA